jgi:hypothetical protein
MFVQLLVFDLLFCHDDLLIPFEVWGVVQSVVECLCRMCNTPGSILTTAKTKKALCF